MRGSAVYKTASGTGQSPSGLLENVFRRICFMLPSCYFGCKWKSIRLNSTDCSASSSKRSRYPKRPYRHHELAGVRLRQEPMGVITSHGPSRESYGPSRKSRGAAGAIALSAADAVLSAERMRTTLSSSAGTPALLRPSLPGSGSKMVAEESPREISGDRGGPTKTKRANPALPRTSQKPEETRARSRSRTNSS